MNQDFSISNRKVELRDIFEEATYEYYSFSHCHMHITMDKFYYSYYPYTQILFKDHILDNKDDKLGLIFAKLRLSWGWLKLKSSSRKLRTSSIYQTCRSSFIYQKLRLSSILNKSVVVILLPTTKLCCLPFALKN